MPEVTFKPFQKVLVRDNDVERWQIELFERYREGNDYPYDCLANSYEQCIPYEGNECLLGTTDSPTPSEPEFRWGDHVEVRDDEDQPWRKGVFINKYINDKYISYYCSIEPSGSCCWRFCRHADW